ncbi:hypothetical protein [Streptomyces sp. NPDC093261]|uniref:hypothetical protein n=1 Tax=Streptomyces sp. NPDC093261 TaxID=3366037 RepID=UPI003817019F
MNRVRVWQSKHGWNAEVVQRALGVDPLPAESVMSPVLLIDGRVEPDASQWLAEVWGRTGGTKTAPTYAEALRGFADFLLDRNATLRGAIREHVVAYVNHRTVDAATRVSGNTWQIDRRAIKQFYLWLRETHGIALPFTLDRIPTARGSVESMREGRNVARVAAAGTPLTPAQIPYLLAAAWRLGLGGVIGDSLTAPRDAAVIGLGLACGARANVLAHLTIWEVPDPNQQGDLIEMRVPALVNKNRREVRLPAFRTHLKHVWDYANPQRGSRRALLRRWRPADPIQVVHATPPGSRSAAGVTTSDGRFLPFNDMTNDDRRRLLTPGGEPATLFLSATSGGPMAATSVGEITADVSRRAEAVAEQDERWFPHVHTHDLRHTYATHLAAVFLLGDVTAGRDLHGERPRLDVASAVKMASVGLGHLDEATTHLYIQQVGLMVAAGYTTSDFLGRT